MGILRYALAIASYLITLSMLGALGLFWWIHMVIDIVLLILFILARPKEVKVAAK